MSNNNEREQKSIESLALRCNAEVFLDAAIQVNARLEGCYNLDDLFCGRCLCEAIQKSCVSLGEKRFVHQSLLISIMCPERKSDFTLWWDSSPFDYESRILAALWLYEMVKDVQKTARRGETTQHD